MIEEELPSSDLREMRQFAKRMMTFWTIIFPAAFMSRHVIDSIGTGSWFLTGVFGGMWLLIGAFAWQIRRAFVLLLDTQDLRDEVGHAELTERKARAQASAARRERAEVRLARIQQDNERRAREEAVEDLVDLAEELGSDTGSGRADT